MAQSNDATIEVEHGGENIKIPAEFERSELAAWFGGVPETFDVDRVFIGEDGELRLESYLGDGEWVEAALHTDEWHETFNARSDRGWVADSASAPAPEDAIEQPGETVWEQ